MPAGRLRRYDVQANYACSLAIISVVPFAAAVALLFRNFSWELRQIVYGEGGLFAPAYVTCVLLSMAPAGVAFLLGFSSAGQRRNDKPGRSWTGFFLGGAVATLDVVLALAFLMLRLKQAG